MKLTYPEIDRVFDTDVGDMNTLIIENPAFLVRLLTDIQTQIGGGYGEAVVSDKGAILDMSKSVEVLDTFVPFDINKKPLLTKIVSGLEKTAVSPDYYERTMKLMADIEQYLDGLAFGYPCDVVFPRLSVSSLLKGAGPELRDDGDCLGERILDYMELVTVFDRPKLYITLNLRGFMSDADIELFSRTALSHGYKILMIESFAREPFPSENRLIIDKDLCEIC